MELCRATRRERILPLPGDALIPRPIATFTHAITIKATAAEVWPWLAQMGSGRAGWYAYDRIDNGGAPSARTIISSLQGLEVGDVMPAVPGAQDAFVVHAIIPNQALILCVPAESSALNRQASDRASAAHCRVSWALVLLTGRTGRTRLLARGRVADGWLQPADSQPASAKPPLLIERVYMLMARIPSPFLIPLAGFGHYLFQSCQLRGIKARAESANSQELGMSN